MNIKIIIRIILDIILLLATINGWWLLAIPLIGFAFRSQDFFVEGLLCAIGYDALFNMNSFFDIKSYSGILTIVMIYFVIKFFKKSVRR